MPCLNTMSHKLGHPQPCQPSRGLSGLPPVALGTHPRGRPRPACCEALPAAAAAAGLALAFLPWSGCSQGGFYATGVEGRHGQDCQAMYQPAAAAEARFAARLKQQQQQQQQQPFNITHSAVSVAAVSDLAPAAASSSSSSSSSGRSSSSEATSNQQQPQGTEAGQPPQQSQQPQLTAAEQLQQVPDAAKDLVRDIMHEDNRQRTKQLVDDAWQTLE